MKAGSCRNMALASACLLHHWIHKGTSALPERLTKLITCSRRNNLRTVKFCSYQAANFDSKHREISDSGNNRSTPTIKFDIEKLQEKEMALKCVGAL